MKSGSAGEARSLRLDRNHPSSFLTFLFVYVLSASSIIGRYNKPLGSRKFALSRGIHVLSSISPFVSNVPG